MAAEGEFGTSYGTSRVKVVYLIGAIGGWIVENRHSLAVSCDEAGDGGVGCSLATYVYY